MKTIFLILLVSALVIFTYRQYDEHNQQQIAAQKAHELYVQEKKAFEKAKNSRDIEQLNDFIRTYPNSDWVEIAYYHRDKLIVNKAVELKNEKRLQNFVQQNPNSQWKQYATQYIKKFKRIHENNEMLKAQQLAKEKLEKKNLTNSTPAQYSSTQNKEPTARADSARERVNRALSIYNKINKQKSREADKLNEQQQKQARVDRDCHKLKNQLEDYKQKRVRWYTLDKQGKRVYMSKQQIANRKKAIEQDMSDYCR